MAVLDEIPQMYPQQRHRSAWGVSGPSGLIGNHSAESMIDRILPDYGAENVLNYIVSRRDPGSYHVLVDSDSVIYLARWSMMTWHIAADSLNGMSTGFSFACRSVDFNPDDRWTQVSIASMGGAMRGFWEDVGVDVARAARWLTRQQVQAAGGYIAGIVNHGTVQPSDRSDAWATHPRRAELDAMLLNAIDRGITINPTPPTSPPKENAEMNDQEWQRIEKLFVDQDTRTRTYIDAVFNARLGTTMGLDDRTGMVWQFERPGLTRSYVETPQQMDWLSIVGNVPYVGALPDYAIDSFKVYPPNLSDADLAKISTFTADEIEARMVENEKVRLLSPSDQEALAAAFPAAV